MCGILFCKRNDNIKPFEIFEHLKPVVHNRGLDFDQLKSEIIESSEYLWYSSVLSLRQPLCQQPIESDNKRFVIQFNGELYNEEILDNMNDVQFLYDRLQFNDYDVVKTIGEMRGEFAYVITDKLSQSVWFGKDSVGKRSLCYLESEEGGDFMISSCPPINKEYRNGFKECVGNTIYYYNNGILSEKGELKQGGQVTSLESNNLPFNVEELYQRLYQCVKERIETIHPLHDSQSDEQSKFAILFSGGIDCTLIAALCADILSKQTGNYHRIDLLNVGFTNPRANLTPSETPDRKLAIKSCNELNNKYKSRGVEFKLIEIDVTYEEYLEAKGKVMDLIYPNDTEMDLSIAIAFYFASGGRGINGLSTCKVLLSGLGADELFGGYTRHEKVFTEYSNYIKRELKKKPQEPQEFDLKSIMAQLKEELQMDIERIWVRNLSRDDKVISSWSKEARYPFLDYNFIEWVKMSIPLDFKLSFNANNGEIVRKKALRELALLMDLEWVSQEPKRAIQFGSKSAKMDLGSGKRHGNDKVGC